VLRREGPSPWTGRFAIHNHLPESQAGNIHTGEGRAQILAKITVVKSHQRQVLR
jgi:hypothetical protein